LIVFSNIILSSGLVTVISYGTLGLFGTGLLNNRVLRECSKVK
jgi:hypothetical protein